MLIADLDGDERAVAAPFLRMIVPDWDEGPGWFAGQIARGAHHGVATTLPGLDVPLRTMADRERLVLTLSWAAR